MNFLKHLLLIFHFANGITTSPRQPGHHHPPPSGSPSLLHLFYQVLEETFSGTFVANLFKDMKLHENLLKFARSNTTNDYEDRKHVTSIENNNRVHGNLEERNSQFPEHERILNPRELFEYTMVDLHDFSSGYYNATHFFEIYNGILKTKVKLDREVICADGDEMCQMSFDVIAFAAQQNVFRQARIKVEIMDINDHEPKFQPDHINLKISESASIGSGFSLPLAIDRDSPRFSIETYLLVSEFFTPFELMVERKASQVPSNGSPNLIKLLLRETLDRERVSWYRMKLIAYDAGDEFVGIPSKTGSLSLDVQVSDVNDNPPLFQSNSSHVEVLESHSLTEPIFKVKATDDDEGVNSEIIYSFDKETEAKFGKVFSIENSTGEIFLRSHLDREAVSSYILEITATDMAGINNPSSLSSVTFLTISVLDINDNRPQIRIFSNDITCPGFEIRLASKHGDNQTTEFINDHRRIKIFLQLTSSHLNTNGFNSSCYLKNIFTRRDSNYKQTWVPLFKAIITDADDKSSGNGAVFVELISVSSTRNKNKFDTKLDDFCSQDNFLFDHSTETVYVDFEIIKLITKEFDNKEYSTIIYGDRSTGIETDDDEAFKIRRKQVCLFIVRATDQGWPSLSSEITVMMIIGDKSNHSFKKLKTKTTLDDDKSFENDKNSEFLNGNERFVHPTSHISGDHINFFEVSHESTTNNNPINNFPFHGSRNSDTGISKIEGDLFYDMITPDIQTTTEYWLHTYLESKDLLLALSVVLFLVMVAVVLAVVIVFHPRNYFINRICGSDNVDKQLIA